MNRSRLALLASCIAVPAVAQEVPNLDVSAQARAQSAQMQAQAEARTRASIAQAQAEAAANASHLQGQNQSAGNGQGTVPRTMPPPVDSHQIAPDGPLNAKERQNLATARRWINHNQRPHLDENGVEHFIPGKGQIFVVAAVNHVTDIALAPGEIVSPPLHIGDADEWHAHPAVSGRGQNVTTHIIIKPDDAGLSSNIIVETNKRTINIALTSRRKDYMPLVALDLPEDTDSQWAAYPGMLAAGQPAAAANVSSPCDQAPSIPPSDFKISGDNNVPWRPVQVYGVSTPVGDKTCVEFPSNIGSQSIPAMMALADDGGMFSSPTKQIINVRFVHRRYIADEMLNRFILVDGVGDDQHSITVTRRNR